MSLNTEKGQCHPKQIFKLRTKFSTFLKAGLTLLTQTVLEIVSLTLRTLPNCNNFIIRIDSLTYF